MSDWMSGWTPLDSGGSMDPAASNGSAFAFAFYTNITIGSSAVCSMLYTAQVLEKELLWLKLKDQ